MLEGGPLIKFWNFRRLWYIFYVHKNPGYNPQKTRVITPGLRTHEVLSKIDAIWLVICTVCEEKVNYLPVWVKVWDS